MAPLRSILIALFTPWGRLPQLTFIVLASIILCVHGALQLYLNTHIETLEPYNAYSIGQLVTLWMLFSILSRRFHDSGNAAMLLVPFFAMTFAAYLFAIDNWKLAVSPFEEDHDTAAWFERVRMVYQLIGFGVIILALKDMGDESHNAYGPPFGAPKKVARHARPADTRAGEAPRMAARRVTSTPVDDTDLAPPRHETPPHDGHRHFEPRRGRITPAEPAGRHHGFGRR